MVMHRFLQIGAKKLLIFDKIQNCADGIRCVRVLRRDRGAARCGNCGRDAGPAVILERRLEPRKIAAERTIAKYRNIRCGLWTAEREKRFWRQRVRLLDWMIHQVAPHGIARIAGTGVQKNPRIFDTISGENDDPARNPILYSVPSTVYNPFDTFLVVVELQFCNDALAAQDCACLQCLLDMDDGFIPRLDRTKWKAGGIPLAGGAVFVFPRIDRVRNGIHLQSLLWKVAQ